MVHAPSPTAEAQRLIEPALTSPAANTPGRLVSIAKGLRSRTQLSGGLSFFRRSEPVTMYPPLSQTTPASAAHCVCGTPPSPRKSQLVSAVHSCPVALFLRVLA